MHPYDLATAWHNARCKDYPFYYIWHAHYTLGTILLTPDSLLLARRVSSTWSEDDLRSPWLIDPAGDSLLLWLQIGPPSLAYRSLIPPGVRFLIYHRGPRLIRRRLSRS